MKLLIENFRKFIVEEEEPKKTIVHIEEEEFVDPDGIMVRKIRWLERYLEILGWELALESALPPSFEDKQ